ncbi:MAG: GNAT family N-acetyltransferase [Desulfobacterales bacterium]|nr:MAG: GNAT family N-acetyltransferase [Desulfobacterales bacterium]
MRCIDKHGKSFEVKKYRLEDYAALEAMYVTFYPKGKFQGMPPLQDEASRKWINGLLENGENFLAWQDGIIVGHVVVLPDFDKGDAEYLIFVRHPNRGRGIGSELSRAVLQHAKNLGLETIWLIVGATNFRAVGLYRKFGFRFCNSDLSESERKMILNL